MLQLARVFVWVCVCVWLGERPALQAVFGLLGVLFALVAAHSALEQRAAPWGAEHAAALRGALSHDALMTAYMLAALTHGGAAAALAALSPRSHEHRRPAWVGDARARGPLCVGAAAAAASCVGWVAACVASRGALLAPPALLLGWGGAGYVAVVVYVIREAGAFGRDLDGLRSARYEFKKA